jgi:hypothetical protein
MNDKQRIEFLAGLVKNCPTASFHFNGDHDMTFPDGTEMPLGFTIRVEGVCDPVRVTASTFRKCVDAVRSNLGDSGEVF